MKNVFAEGELEENSVCRDFRHTAEDGKSYNTRYYSLRAIPFVEASPLDIFPYRIWRGRRLFRGFRRR